MNSQADSHDMREDEEDIFGPFVSVIPFEDEAEVLRMANANVYGLPAHSGRATLAAPCGLPKVSVPARWP